MRKFACGALCAVLSLAGILPAWSQQLRTSDDIWVYGRASDPIGDPIMRVWGDGTRSYLDTWPIGDEFSYGYLKFDLRGIPVGRYRVVEATLLLTSLAARYTRAQGEANPLEARALAPTFSEATWFFDDPANPAPQATLYGTGDLSAYSSTQPFPLPIDLRGAAFTSALNGAIGGGREIAIALTSRILVGSQGGTPYRVYTKEDGGGRGPVLRLRLSRLQLTPTAGSVTP
jgi:hypothetical protein